MNILLTGSNGFVGRHLKERLLKLGHTIHCFNRGDILFPELVDEDFGGPLDVLINCAAETTQIHKMYESNVELVERLLTFSQRANVKKVIHLGSSSEYGRIILPRREDMFCSPFNIYDATKLAATHLCQGYASQYNMDVVIARPFSLYGPFDRPRKLVSRLYKSFTSHERIEVYESGHDWLFIDDFIDGLITLMNAPKELTKGDIVNFGSGISSTNVELVQAMEEALGSSLNVEYKKGKYHPYDVDYWVADITKARTKYGWTPKLSLKSGIKEFVMREWFAEDKG